MRVKVFFKKKTNFFNFQKKIKITDENTKYHSKMTIEPKVIQLITIPHIFSLRNGVRGPGRAARLASPAGRLRRTHRPLLRRRTAGGAGLHSPVRRGAPGPEARECARPTVRSHSARRLWLGQSVGIRRGR